MNPQNKRAVVTGATSGIGLSIAKTLAEAGCDILLSGFGSPTMIETLRKSLEAEYNVKALYFEADLVDPQQCRAFINHAFGAWGEIDILVNNAGIQHIAAVEETSTEKWDAVLAINLSAAFHLIAAALPGMKRRNFGRIINIASVHGLVGSKNKVAYVAAKHGLVGVTKVVALETAGQGITCNAICPGFVSTPILDAQIEERMRVGDLSRTEAERLLLSEKQPSGQFAKAEEISALVKFLCSDAAASLTGSALTIDGGWTAQ